MTNATFDQERADAFAEGFLSALNHGAMCLMVSVGHRTGLFDAMRSLPPSTSAEVAAAAGLNERYVREWLGAMVTARVVEVDPDGPRFSLPAEHAAFLTRAAGADNIAVFAQYIAELGSVEGGIVHCFKHGGGVSYDKFPRFHALMAEDSGQSVLSSLESHVVPLVPGLADRLASGIRVLDLGCGAGRILNRLAELYPQSRFTGLDLSDEAVGVAREDAKRTGLSNIEFVARDLADGVYLMQDIKGSSHVHKNLDHPIGTFLYTVSTMHCMTVSLAQDGEGLGAMWGEEKTREYLAMAGFASVEKHELAHDIQNNWYVVKK
jgi:hypothetical protein